LKYYDILKYIQICILHLPSKATKSAINIKFYVQ